jgi:hypothetical protein
VALNIRRTAAVNVHMALNEKNNLCPIARQDQPGHRLRSVQARLLPESFTGNSFAQRL